jgi:sugar lactone lactonase YvrE
MSSLTKPRVLLDGLAYVESARWHEGRLWFAHWGTGEVVAVDMDGRSEVVAHGPSGLGWSIDWCPDGQLLVTGPELLRQDPDGSMVEHADLGAVADYRWNEIVVDGRGNIYVNGFGFDTIRESYISSATFFDYSIILWRITCAPSAFLRLFDIEV